MLLKTKTTPQANWLLPKTPEAITPYSLTLVLAYLQYYTPKRLKNGRFLAVEHLRNLAAWINHPLPRLRSLHQHKILALHLALLRAAEFIPAQSSQLDPQPAVTSWLHTTPPETINKLLLAVTDPERWQQACADLDMQNSIGPDNTAYLQQSLSRQAVQPLPEATVNLHWLKTEEESWQLHIPHTLPLWLQFDLRQLGNWQPQTNLICTPLTITAAVQRGYNEETIQWLLETAAQTNLPPQQKIQLHQWSQRATAHRLRTVHLLSTAQPDQMAALLRQKRLRTHVIDHLSPRHAVVSSAIQPHLEKWLATQAYPLNYQQPATDDLATLLSVPLDEQTAVQWLGLRLLIALGEIIPRPYPPPHALFEQLDSRLDATTKTDLEAIVTTLLTNLRDAMRGRDTFFPSHQPVSSTTLATIRQAIWDETSLNIYYRALSSQQPSWREIQPLRLEQRRDLTYLHAYCLRAEANLTFRLDRIYDIE